MELFSNSILSTKKLIQESKFDNNKEVVHIGFGIDVRFALGMGVLMTSIILNNPNKKFGFHVFTDKISDEDIARLEVLAKNEAVEITIYYINLKAFEKFPTSAGWSHATYYRFVMAEKLYGIADKLLYLDADILCVGAIDELLTIDMEDNIILGIDDCMTDFDKKVQNLSIKHGHYFNAGVMYIDVKKWHDEKIASRAMQMILKDPLKYTSLDQDVLNVLLDGKTKYIDIRWDHIYNMGFMNHKLPKKTVLIHYTGDKPWQRWTEHHFMVTRYHGYMEKSPWGLVPLIEPTHYKQKRKMANSYKKQKEYFRALKWYIKYIVTRTKTKMNSK
jgi:lipopolysaccharide biosynthesis glycosyltransferase